MHRGVVLSCFAASVLLSGAWACTQDFGIFDPKADASNDGGGGDGGGGDGGDGGDGAVATCNLPSGCQADAAACGQPCTSTYNTCVTSCGGSNPCKNQCKNAESTCFQGCQGACVNCSGQGAICASACQTAVGF
ncbi:MAG TPA: hypothetical protein VLM85_06440 [Polyangiaceae bacterium]|nr:hypothetical protein [Polyangiaceae bacterium]